MNEPLTPEVPRPPLPQGKHHTLRKLAGTIVLASAVFAAKKIAEARKKKALKNKIL